MERARTARAIKNGARAVCRGALYLLGVSIAMLALWASLVVATLTLQSEQEYQSLNYPQATLAE